MRRNVKKSQCVLIMGRCGYGKTSIVNRMLGTHWNTCAYDTGTMLPFIKIFKRLDCACHEMELVPYVNSRRANVKVAWKSVGSKGLSMRQVLTETIHWEVEKDTITKTELNPLIRSITFVDLMGIGDSLITEHHYKTIYREFAGCATHILWVVDATRRGYSDDIATLREMDKYLVKLEKFTVLLNKSDSIGLKKGETSFSVPTDEQMELIVQKKQDVLSYLQGCVPRSTGFSETDIVPISAKYGWNFEQVENLFFNRK